MRVAALYDVHGNLPALEAVLADADRLGAQLIVAGGDVVSGPMPAAVLARLGDLGNRLRVIRGNADREVVSLWDDPPSAGRLRGDPAARTDAWVAERLDREARDAIAAWPASVSLDVDGLGPVCFCHATPRSDEEIITPLTPDDVVVAALTVAGEPTVVAGHTHRQGDRRLAGRRLINAGSVGMPYEGTAGAYWALLGPGVDLRRTSYDLDAAATAIGATGFPDADDLLRDSLLEPVDPDVASWHFEDRRVALEARRLSDG